MRIILASGSPRRSELLKMMGLEFEIIKSDAEEELIHGLSVEEQIKHLAYVKAKTVFEETQGERVVIGSDTMVVKNGKTYGKPANEIEAFKMLRELNNSYHEVITGLSVLSEQNGKCTEYCIYNKSKVHIVEMSDDEIKRWIDSGECMDKAGAYAIQGRFGVYVDEIQGDYYTIVGLPIHEVYKILKELEEKKVEYYR